MIFKFEKFQPDLAKRIWLIGYGLVLLFALNAFVQTFKTLMQLKSEMAQWQWRYQITVSNIKKIERYETLYRQLNTLYETEYQRYLIADPTLFTQKIAQFADSYQLQQAVVKQQDIYRDQSLSISAFTFKATGQLENLSHFLLVSMSETNPLGITACQISADNSTNTLIATYLFTTPHQIYTSQMRFRGLAKIDPSILVSRRGSEERATGVYQSYMTVANDDANKAENQKTKGI